MAAPVFTIRGDKDLRDRLKQLASKKIKAALVKAEKRGAKILRKRTRDLMPVKSGRAKKAVKTKTKSKGTRVSAFVRIRGDEAPHGGLIEYGTKDRVQKTTGRRTGKMPAFHPLLRASEEVGQQALDKTIEELKSEVEAAIRGH